MKKILISMLAVAALVSCSKEESIRIDQGELISFGNAFVDNSTRAAAATDPSYSAATLQYFDVYGAVGGVNIYDGDKVTRGSAALGEAWSLASDAPKQYWIAGANYKFVGIVDGNKSGVTATTVENGMPTSISYTADGKTDLLCQTITYTAKPAGQTNGLVAFNFNHLLSKVNFTVNNDSQSATGYSFVVKNIKFNGATAATYNVETAAWGAATTGDTIIGNERTVDSTPVKDIVVASGAEKTELATEVLFLPGTYTISFTVDILYDGKLVTTTNYPATEGAYQHTLAANNAYNFNVGVSVGEKIQFTVTQKPTWTDGDGVNDTTLTL